MCASTSWVADQNRRGHLVEGIRRRDFLSVRRIGDARLDLCGWHEMEKVSGEYLGNVALLLLTGMTGALISRVARNGVSNRARGA